MARQLSFPRLLLAAEIAALAMLGVIAAAASMPMLGTPTEAEAVRHDVRRQPVCSGSNSVDLDTVCDVVYLSGNCCTNNFETVCAGVCCTATCTPPPTPSPTMSPTPSPTMLPTRGPTSRPTQTPTMSPTPSPTMLPTPGPTYAPMMSPTPGPTPTPTICTSSGSGSGSGSGDDDDGCDDDDDDGSGANDVGPGTAIFTDDDDSSSEPGFAASSSDDDGLSDGSIALIVIAVVLVIGVAISVAVHRYAADQRPSISGRSKAYKGVPRISRTISNSGLVPFVTLERDAPVKISHI